MKIKPISHFCSGQISVFIRALEETDAKLLYIHDF